MQSRGGVFGPLLPPLCLPTAPLLIEYLAFSALKRVERSLRTEGQWIGSTQVAGLDSFNAKPGIVHHNRDRSVEMTPAAHVLPDWCEVILPPNHPIVRCSTVLKKQKAATWSQDANHLTQSACSVRNAAERPGRHDGIDASILKRNGLC
jgi:hypothetical protein